MTHPFTTRKKLFAAITGVAVMQWATADTTDPAIPIDLDISKWQCKYCEFEQGWRGFIELGALNLNESADKFGEYNGLYSDGPNAIVNGQASYRNNEGQYLDLRLNELGLSTRELFFEAGKQGRYAFNLDYDEITHFIASDLSTPYSGEANLQLPSNWVNIGSSSELPVSLNRIDLKTQRRKIDIGALYIPAKHWETAIKASHEVRSGHKRSAGAFFFSAVELAQPTDYITDEIEVSANYTNRKFQSNLSYFISSFKNDYATLRFQNPYNPIVSGADYGELAQPPDNQFQQLQSTSGYQWGQTRLFGSFSLGQMEQTVDLLSPTLNQALVVELPTEDTRAKVNTLNANIRVLSRLSPSIQLKLRYYFNERDNKTESRLYQWVTTDGFVNPIARRNLPYSYSTERKEIEGLIKLNGNTKLTLGYELKDQDRDYQEVDTTSEDTLWAKLKVRYKNIVDLNFKVLQSGRNASDFNPVADIDPEQNPLMRKYNMADRDRHASRAGANFFLHERVMLDLSVESARDTYTESPIGLQRSAAINHNADVSFAITDRLNTHLYTSREKITSLQAGSEHFSNADWLAHNDEKITSFGAGINFGIIEDKLDFKADFVRSEARGNTRIDTYVPGTDFPELSTKFTRITAQLEYEVKTNLSLYTSYWYEQFDAQDWARDEISPSSINKVITLGYNPLDYDIQALSVSVRYAF